MNTAPSGYLKANGAAVSRTAYAALFAAIGTTFGVGDGSTTFALPDLRGEFIRGWDDSRGVDSGRVFGSAQLDALQQHDHANSLFAVGGSAVGADGASYTLRTAGPVTGARTATETRSRNVALLACIKF
jgi:phage-related tail fiber protein